MAISIKISPLSVFYFLKEVKENNWHFNKTSIFLFLILNWPFKACVVIIPGL